ncbi:uncharacterized protein TRIADDRAFT_26388 [Trichoplax adhaerens]|uniref:tRNA-t(6)A37 methylthiotransferase n=1 Tax=Trichoplax adhaerens TaxID=10228 RepID=B3RZX5_TRIAD|nr:hypothetical protein TRIADDRAFT_26388 [Trichoplax adhaerens]EDV24289.1 hypothetical protein TRIADDRAFT_26388 [Trichoplax adhaerens]|eukprot:XP_002113815.1 hypothetical protein TRIADDRAFT_26388 [Trichoplax adhaerens]
MSVDSQRNAVEDIEDLISKEESYSVDVRSKISRNNVKLRSRPSKRQGKSDSNVEVDEKAVGDSIIPGTQGIYIRTWGCSHNKSDGEYMAGQLSSYGYKITEIPEEADLWLLNSCAVKNPAEDSFYNDIRKAKELKKYLVLAGCVPQGQKRHPLMDGISVVGVQQIDRVVEVVEETLKGHSVRLFGQKRKNGKKLGGAPLNLPKIRKNPLVEIIAINTGCLNACTYCKTKHARGDLGSYPIEDIVERAKTAFNEGVAEIWITSEDTGAYGIDIGVSLPDLLWQLVKVIPDGAMLRIGMTNPPYILEHLEEMAKILSHPRVYSFLHVPVQAGSDKVLYDMRREYTVTDFEKVVNYLSDKVPGITIATDIICGFPTEEKDDFAKTLRLIERHKFPSVFINQFYPRPGTPAAKMKRIPTEEVKNRSRELTQLFKSYRPYDHKLGERQRILITELSHDGNHFVGHNKFYDQVLVPMDMDLLGKTVEVDIIETGKHYLMGRVVRETLVNMPRLSLTSKEFAAKDANSTVSNICIL